MLDWLVFLWAVMVPVVILVTAGVWLSDRFCDFVGEVLARLGLIE